MGAWRRRRGSGGTARRKRRGGRYASVMRRPEAQRDQAQGIDFAIRNLVVGLQILVCLETFESVGGIVTPGAVHFAFEVAAIGQRLLDLLIAFRVWVQLIAWRRRYVMCNANGAASMMRSAAVSGAGGRVVGGAMRFGRCVVRLAGCVRRRFSAFRPR